METLNRTIGSEQMLLAGGVRGYARILGKQTPYFDNVHIRSIGEEHEQHRSLMALFQQSSDQKGGIYAGAAGFINLSYVAALQPRAALFYDVNILQAPFWQQTIQLLAHYQTRENFKNALMENARHFSRHLRTIFNDISFLKDIPIDRIFVDSELPYRDIDRAEDIFNVAQYELRADGFWDTDENYAILHTMARKGDIGALTLDIADKKACAQLAATLIDDKIDVLYVSNIFEFLTGAGDFTGRRDLPNSTPDGLRAAMKCCVSEDCLVIDHDPCIADDKGQSKLALLRQRWPAGTYRRPTQPSIFNI